MGSTPNLPLGKYAYFQGDKHAELLDRLMKVKIGTAFELAGAMFIFWEKSGLVFKNKRGHGVLTIKTDVNVLHVHMARILKEMPPDNGTYVSSKEAYNFTAAIFPEFEKALESYFGDPDTDKNIVKFAAFQTEFRRFLRQQFKEGKRYKPERPSGGVEKPAEAARNEA